MKTRKPEILRRKNISKEKPLFINPCDIDPGLHIGFHKHIAYPKIIDGKISPQGKYTIDILKLNDRSDLVVNREIVWNRMETAIRTVDIAKRIIESGLVKDGIALLGLTEKSIKEMLSEKSEYSGMFVNQTM